MKYEVGDFVEEHRDSLWMCQSNYWKPNTNQRAKDLMVIPLNDDYEGGEFTVNGTEVKQEVGSVIQFPQSGIPGFRPRPKHGVKKQQKVLDTPWYFGILNEKCKSTKRISLDENKIRCAFNET